MSADLGVGDWVECISGIRRPHLDTPVDRRLYVPGGVYQVSDIHIWHGEAAINCVGMVRPADHGFDGPGWDINCFRPIRSDITEIERLLTITTDSKADQPETVGG